MVRPSFSAAFSFFTGTIGASKSPADVFSTSVADAVEKQPPWHPPSEAFCLLWNSFEGALCALVCARIGGLRLHCLCARVCLRTGANRVTQASGLSPRLSL